MPFVHVWFLLFACVDPNTSATWHRHNTNHTMLSTQRTHTPCTYDFIHARKVFVLFFCSLRLWFLLPHMRLYLLFALFCRRKHNNFGIPISVHFHQRHAIVGTDANMVAAVSIKTGAISKSILSLFEKFIFISFLARVCVLCSLEWRNSLPDTCVLYKVEITEIGEPTDTFRQIRTHTRTYTRTHTHTHSSSSYMQLKAQLIKQRLWRCVEMEGCMCGMFSMELCCGTLLSQRHLVSISLVCVSRLHCCVVLCVNGFADLNQHQSEHALLWVTILFVICVVLCTCVVSTAGEKSEVKSLAVSPNRQGKHLLSDVYVAIGSTVFGLIESELTYMWTAPYDHSPSSNTNIHVVLKQALGYHLYICMFGYRDSMSLVWGLCSLFSKIESLCWRLRRLFQISFLIWLELLCHFFFVNVFVLYSVPGCSQIQWSCWGCCSWSQCNCCHFWPLFCRIWDFMYTSHLFSPLCYISPFCFVLTQIWKNVSKI